MPSGPRILLDNVCYHIIARGNQKQQIFKQCKDFKAYLKRLKKYKKQYRFLLYAYCLMPNHIHLVGEITPCSNLSHFMSCLLRSYTAYFNNKYEKEGHLWQGRFRSKIIAKDKYLVDCMGYVEANPVKDQLVTSICEYEWSSYKERALGSNSDKPLIDELCLLG